MTIAEVEVAPDLRRVAHELAEANGNSEPAVSVVYWFPAPAEIRLIVVDSTIAPNPLGEAVAPFHFGKDTKGGVPYRSAIAMLAPEDDHQAPLPPGWCSWDEAEAIWSRP
ncbi:MAG: hypothetical protein M3Y56_01525 [Armatimonadota bacterium]|nr:hypothetical protein [Armatimonadota bacterium]